MTQPDDSASQPKVQADPQTHLDTDPTNEPDTVQDPAHDTDEDEGAAPSGSATDT